MKFVTFRRRPQRRKNIEEEAEEEVLIDLDSVSAVYENKNGNVEILIRSGWLIEVTDKYQNVKRILLAEQA